LSKYSLSVSCLNFHNLTPNGLIDLNQFTIVAKQKKKLF